MNLVNLKCFNMEAFNQYMRDIISLQQKSMGFLYENTKTPLTMAKDYDTFMKNCIKFHLAAQDYHKASVQMLEAMQSITDIYKIKP